MANTKSAKKDLRRSTKRRLANIATKSALKTYIKKVKTASNTGDAENVKVALIGAVKALDKAAQKGVIHKNQAARRKSRAAKAANKVLGAKAAAV